MIDKVLCEIRLEQGQELMLEIFKLDPDPEMTIPRLEAILRETFDEWEVTRYWVQHPVTGKWERPTAIQIK